LAKFAQKPWQKACNNDSGSTCLGYLGKTLHTHRTSHICGLSPKVAKASTTLVTVGGILAGFFGTNFANVNTVLVKDLKIDGSSFSPTICKLKFHPNLISLLIKP
jgi:hypothetical protein